MPMIPGRENWIRDFQNRYESRYPGWDVSEEPRDLEHARLFMEAKSDAAMPLHWKRDSMYLVIDGKFVTMSNIQVISGCNTMPETNAGKWCGIPDKYPESNSKPVTVAFLKGCTPDDIVMRIRNLFSPTKPSNTLDIGLARVKLNGDDMGCAVAEAIFEYEPVLADDPDA